MKQWIMKILKGTFMQSTTKLDYMTKMTVSNQNEYIDLYINCNVKYLFRLIKEKNNKNKKRNYVLTTDF